MMHSLIAFLSCTGCNHLTTRNRNRVSFDRKRIISSHVWSSVEIRRSLFSYYLAVANKSKSPLQMNSERHIDIQRTIQTNGGWIFEVHITNKQQTSRHTVLLGRRLLVRLFGTEHQEASLPQEVIHCVFTYLMDKGVSLKNTEGLFDSSQFPINYFSVSQLFYFYPDCEDFLKQQLTPRHSVS